MKKLFLALLCSLVAVSSSTFAYTPTTEDHDLLNRIFQRVESLYLQHTQKLLTFYEKLPLVSGKYRVMPQNAYLLDRLERHIELLLFTSVYDDQFVCLPSYVQEDDTVSIHYKLSTMEGKVIDTTWEDMSDVFTEIDASEYIPLVFNAGKGQILEGFDEEILGKQLGEMSAFIISPEKGFGDWNASLLKITSREGLERKVGPLVEGENYSVKMTLTTDGTTLISLGRIVDMDAETVTMDFNHPYAGQSLLGNIQLESLFKACTIDEYPMHTRSGNSGSETHSEVSSGPVVMERDSLK